MSHQGHFVFPQLSPSSGSMGKRSCAQSSTVEGISNNQRIPGTGSEIIVLLKEGGMTPVAEPLSDRCELGGDTGCVRGQNSSLDEFICNALHIRDTLQQNTPIVSVRHVNTEL